MNTTLLFTSIKAMTPSVSTQPTVASMLKTGENCFSGLGHHLSIQESRQISGLLKTAGFYQYGRNLVIQSLGDQYVTVFLTHTCCIKNSFTLPSMDHWAAVKLDSTAGKAPGVQSWPSR